MTRMKMRFNNQKKLYRQNALTQSNIRYLPDSSGLDVTVVSGKCVAYHTQHTWIDESSGSYGR